MNSHNEEPQAPATAPVRRAWVAPEVEVLPRLTDLTLQTFGGDIFGSGGESGSTVIP